MSATLVILVAFFIFLPSVALAQIRPQAAETIEARKEMVASRTAIRKEVIEAKKEQFALIREKHASVAAAKKEALKEKFRAFKDQKKVTVAKRLDSNLDKINQNRTSSMLTQLERMETVLDKVETRAASASAEGKDTTLVVTAVSAARASVDQSRATVEAQVVKDYTVSATSEAKLKEEFKLSRDKLLTDLKTIHQQIFDSKKLVVAAVQALEGLLTP